MGIIYGQVRIFAKHKTDEKVVILCPEKNIRQVMGTLAEKYGGSWLLVESLDVDEIIKFNDGQVYNGYTPKIKRYCSKIETLTIE